MKAIWNNQVLADSDDTLVVEGNHYFPPSSLNRDYLSASEMRSTCHWKGEACYFTITVDEQQNEDAAWYYPSPSPAAANIKDYVAFWKGVELKE
ncbi:hypothetical protein CL628_01530 [bacterium]|nr:hypothetical protein [bacterium]